jgi:hypothetical protein
MNRKLSILLTVIACLAIVFSTGGQARASSSSAAAFTYYYTIWGHEGIPTIGDYGSTTHGPTPSVGDYSTTHCRYINVPSTHSNDYFLLYPVHLPQGVTITKVSAFIADFSASTALYVHFMRKPWNSVAAPTDDALFNSTGSASNTVYNSDPLSYKVNNQNTQYWIEMHPANSADPGQLCVYSIQITYTSEGALLPMVGYGD